jgi:hypothetical protein
MIRLDGICNRGARTNVVDAAPNCPEHWAMLKRLQRMIARRVDYSTRFHLMQRYRSLDFKFLAAVAALVVIILVVMRLY